jgi:hypothetical protein
MEQSPAGDSNSSSVCQEILRLFALSFLQKFVAITYPEPE